MNFVEGRGESRPQKYKGELPLFFGIFAFLFQK
jgi:hypothetical protein